MTAADSRAPVAVVLRALYLGDMLTGLPALAMVRRALPGHRVLLAAPRQVGELAVLAGSVDDVVPGRELEPLTLAPRRPAIAIDLHGNGPGSRDLLAALRPARLVAYAAGSARWRADEHEVQRWCRLVEAAFPSSGNRPPLAGSLPRARLPEAPAPRGCTVVHPGAKSRARRWPAQRFAAVCAALRAGGHDVVVTGGPGEEQLARQVAAASGARPLTGLGLPQLLALVADAGLLVCGDTGVAHAASTFRTPSVVLFGPVPPAEWGPPDAPWHRALWHGTATRRGDPHAAAPDPDLLSISTAEVLAACGDVLAAAPSGKAPADA